MIKIENVHIFGWEGAINGMRNPMNSWNKSDTNWIRYYTMNNQFCDDFIGDNDLNLMKKLSKAGSDHGKFLRMIHVQMDVTAPMYWWSEYDTYKVGTVANSCSKMHKLLAKPFEMCDFSFDKLPGYKKECKQFRPDVDEETELWRRYDCEYDVSNQGRIRHGSRILSGSLHKDGYVFVTLYGKQHRLHRLIAERWCDGYLPTKEVNHKDGNKQNNFADNLEWVTRSQNQQHAVANGLQPKGLSTYQGKFTPEQREEIKALWDSGISRRKIAMKFGVSHTCINDICNDKCKYAEKTNIYEEVARPIVDTLNELRDAWFNCDNTNGKKTIWYSIIQLLPSSYNQKRTLDLNYAVLKAMYHARKNHKLDEWREFCKWIETLPYAKELIVEG